MQQKLSSVTQDTRMQQNVSMSETKPSQSNNARPLPPATATKLRVLLFSNSIAVGGMEEHIELLARHLDREHFEVFAICPNWQPTETFSQSLLGISDHLALITPDRRYGYLSQIKETWRFMQYLRKWKIQVIHMHSTTYRGQYTALLVARLGGIKQVYVTEHLAPSGNVPFFERLSRNLFSSMINGIVCVSEKNYLARANHMYTPHDRTVVVANGVDVYDFTPTPTERLSALKQQYGIASDAQIVGTVVRFEPEKGLNDLVDAFAIIRAKYPHAHLLMVGDGSLRGDLEQQAKTLGMSDYVHFTGFQSDPRPYLDLMDAFVLPVPVGSMSIGLLEAMAMRRAVVITFGGEGEAVVHGESGFCAEPRNASSIAHYVTSILQDSTLQHAFGQAARRRVEEHFSAQRVAEILGNVYMHGISQ